VCAMKLPGLSELRKLYSAVRDASAANQHLVRVIDESGEDYLIRQTTSSLSGPANVKLALSKAS